MADESSSVFERVSAAAGEAAARALIGAFGGRRVYLPAEPGPQHKVTRALGIEAAAKICNALGPGVVSIPRSYNPGNPDLGPTILSMSAQKVPAGEIARRLKCTERTVYRWRAKVRDC